MPSESLYVTFKSSIFSGLKRPPERSWARSWVRDSIAFKILISRFEKSKASSTAVARAAPSTGGAESVFAWERFALPDFLEKRDVEEKDLEVFIRDWA